MTHATHPRSATSQMSLWVLYGEPVFGIMASCLAIAAISTIYLVADSFPNDFTVFLESARWLRQGADLYQRPLHAGPGYNLNTPASVLLFAPFSFLPDAIALRLWTAIAIVSYLFVAYWISRAVARERFVSVAAAMFASQAVVTSILLGQIGAVLTLLITAAWLADRADRPIRAGILMGVAIGVKPFLAVFGAYALWRRSRPMLAGLSLGFAAASFVGLLAAGVSGFESWLGALGKISWSAHVVNGSLHGLFTRIFAINDPVLHATPILVRPQWVQPLWWASVAIVVVLGARALVLTRNRDAAWSLVLVGSLLVSPLGWEYYGTIFAGPLIALVLVASQRARILIGIGYLCTLTPPITLPALGVLGILVFGSIYSWGFLLIFAGVVIAAADRLPEARVRQGKLDQTEISSV